MTVVLVALPGLLFGATCGLLGFALGGMIATRDMRELRAELEAVKRRVLPQRG